MSIKERLDLIKLNTQNLKFQILQAKVQRVIKLILLQHIMILDNWNKSSLEDTPFNWLEMDSCILMEMEITQCLDKEAQKLLLSLLYSKLYKTKGLFKLRVENTIP